MILDRKHLESSLNAWGKKPATDDFAAAAANAPRRVDMRAANDFNGPTSTPGVPGYNR